MAQISLGIQTYESRSLPVSAQRVVNLYQEISPQEAKTKLLFLGTPGLKLFTTVGAGPIYGMHNMDGILYVVSGNDLWQVNSDGTTINRGSLGFVNGRVDISENKSQLFIVLPNTQAFVYTAALLTLTQVTATGFPGATSTIFLGSYTLVNKPSSRQFFWSTPLDSTAWDALDFESAEITSDNIVQVFSSQQELWVFKETSTELFNLTTDFNLPFQAQANASMNRGCAAQFSIVNIESAIYWLGDDRVIYATNGYRPQRVSNHGIEDVINKMTVISDAFGFYYNEEGHKFYILTFPTEMRTFCYDVMTGLWHERESVGLGRWRPNAFANCYNKNYVGDFQSGKLYEISLETYDEDGVHIERINTFPPVFQENKRIIFDRLNIDMETGVGLVVGQGSDPQIMLDWSDDGGFTWSHQNWRTFGMIGNRTRRVTYRRLGQGRERVFRIKGSDPVKVGIYNAFVDVRPGSY